MEYPGNGDLSKYAYGGISEPEIREIAENVLRGLEIMHKEGFTHRDLKPQNILVVQKRPEHQRWWVKIADFGLSKQTFDSGTALYTFAGTRPYCAPEILGYLEGQETFEYTSQVDMWSFGCVLYSLVSRGQLPFTDPDLVRYCAGIFQFSFASRPAHISDGVKTFIAALLQVQPDQRPTATEALRDPWLKTTGPTNGNLRSLLPSSSSGPQNYRPLSNVEQSANNAAKATSPDPVRIKMESATNETLPSQPDLVSLWIGVNNDLIREGTTTKTPRREVMIILAVEQGELEIVQKLVAQGIRSCTRNAQGMTTLHVATDKGHLDVAKWIAEEGVNPSSTDSRGRSPLHTVESAEIAKWLVQQGADLELRDGDGSTPLFKAAYMGNLGVTKCLVKHGVNLQVTGQLGRSPLHEAVAEGHLQVVKCLIENGADLEARSSDGTRPLHVATRLGRSDIVELLVTRGADLEMYDSNLEKPLCISISEGYVGIMECLIEYGASMEICRWDVGTGHPLHLAACLGRIEVMKWLIERGADLDVRDKSGRTPLHQAVSHRMIKTMKWLIKHGADQEAMDTELTGPLHVAAIRGDLDAVKFLVSQGCNIWAEDVMHQSPLQVAQTHKFVNCSKVVAWLEPYQDAARRRMAEVPPGPLRSDEEHRPDDSGRTLTLRHSRTKE